MENTPGSLGSQHDVTGTQGLRRPVYVLGKEGADKPTGHLQGKLEGTSSQMPPGVP